jgi:UDP-galactopyranose mutase
MPKHGYTAMFKTMLDHPNIDLALGTDYNEVKGTASYRRIIFTGPIDEYFDHRFGRLPYRSLRFQHVTLNTPKHQPVAVVNFPQTEDYTRVTEYKHLTGQTHPLTALTYEYPSEEGDPYYPIPRPENQTLYKSYQRLAAATSDVWFVGRLATYRYYNMDQIVGQALMTFERIEESVARRTRVRPAAARTTTEAALEA